MQFQVPQFIEVEDKIVGPLTFKQFVFIAGGLGMAYVVWRVLPIFAAAPLVIGVLGFAAALAFFQVNGRPFILALENAFYYILHPKLYLWNNERSKKPAIKKASEPSRGSAGVYVPKLSDSRLHELAWSLDINERIAAGTVDDEDRGSMDPVQGLRVPEQLVAQIKRGMPLSDKSMPETTNKRVVSRSTQDFVPISEVRDGIVVLKDGGLRAVLLASSINFALKSEDEQTAFIVQFQNFLNSLDFSVQIFVQSRMLDIRPYVATLEVQYKQQLDDLMRIQIREYIEFIKSFTEAANIMTKNFFVVVPYSPAVITKKNGPASYLPFGGGKKTAEEQNRSFEEQVSQLEQRISIVQQGLVRTGVRTVQLGTRGGYRIALQDVNPGEDGKPMPVPGQE